jgi:hypothetical protein
MMVSGIFLFFLRDPLHTSTVSIAFMILALLELSRIWTLLDHTQL